MKINLGNKQNSLSSSNALDNYDIIDIVKIDKELGVLREKINWIEKTSTKEVEQLKNDIKDLREVKNKEREIKFSRWTTIASILINVVLLIISIILGYKQFIN